MYFCWQISQKLKHVHSFTTENNEKNHYNLCSHIYDCKHVFTSTTKNELPSGN